MQFLRSIISIILVISLFWYLLIKYDFSGIQYVINPSWIALLPSVILTTVLVQWVGSIQLNKLLKNHNIIASNISIFRAQMISSFYSLFIPGGMALGGGISWYIISKNQSNSLKIGASLIFVRLIQTFIAIIIGLLAVIIDPVASQIFSTRYILLALTLTIIGLVIIAWPIPIQILERRVQLKLIEKILQAARVGHNNFTSQLGYSFIIYILSTLSTFIAIHMCHIDIPLSTLLWIRGLLTIIPLIPITNSGLGVREVTLVSLLTTYYSSSPTASLAFSLIPFAISIFIFGSIGGYFINSTKKFNAQQDK